MKTKKKGVVNINKKVIIGIVVIVLLAGVIILGRNIINSKNNDVIITEKEDNENNETNVVPQQEEKETVKEGEQIKEKDINEKDNDESRKKLEQGTKYVDITKVTKNGSKYIVTVQEYELYTLSEKEIQYLKNGGTLILPDYEWDDKEYKFRPTLEGEIGVLRSEDNSYYITNEGGIYYLNFATEFSDMYKSTGEEKTYIANKNLNITYNEEEVYTTLETLVNKKIEKQPVANSVPYIINVSNGEIISIYKLGY